MATAKVIAHSFKIKRHSDGAELDSPATLLLAEYKGREVRVSVPVTRRDKPAIDSKIEITEPLEQVKPRYNAHGMPVKPEIVYSANLLSKTTPSLTKREPAKQPEADR